MAVQVLRYEHRHVVRWGVVEGDRVRAVRGDWPGTREFMLEGAARARAGDLEQQGVELSAVQALPPVTSDRQFLCQAINYHSHLRESGLTTEASPFNIFFRKASSCICAADSDIVCPSHVRFLDYEVELGLVFSRDVSDPIEVREDNLADYVGGLVVLNDVSARDVQLPEMQFYKGKSYRTFGPTGPFLVLVDAAELARLDELRLSLRVNGEVRQDSYADDMVHKPAATLRELSQVQDWQAGDLLATVTPGGCALQAPPAPLRILAQLVSARRRQQLLRAAAERNPRRLRHGDMVEASIRTNDGRIDLGTQRNKVLEQSRG
jgi:2-keto-4-pentenoate hydratase/2-oxohepta-3-ene-1,7-dioic acid hydratase in catechol pathway